jgi:hypothetical protein
MCSVSWVAAAGALDLFFNRDEQRTRAPGLPPVSGDRNNVRFFFPVDGKSGGTWIAANNRGLVTGLLNHYAADTSPMPPTNASRGAIIPGLIDAATPAEAAERLTPAEAATQRPFLLILLHHARPGVRLTWDGVALARKPLDPARGFLTTSSFRTAEVVPSRHAVAAQTIWDATTLHDLHASHLPERGPFSICMHRPDARTVSFTRIHSGPDEVRLDYHADAPCRPAPVHTVRMPRVG